jgi:hypothetical protein
MVAKKKKISLYEAAKQFTDKHCKGVRVSAKYCKGCLYHVGGSCIHPKWLELKLQIKNTR